MSIVFTLLSLFWCNKRLFFFTLTTLFLVSFILPHFAAAAFDFCLFIHFVIFSYRWQQHWKFDILCQSHIKCCHLSFLWSICRCVFVTNEMIFVFFCGDFMTRTFQIDEITIFDGLWSKDIFIYLFSFFYFRDDTVDISNVCYLKLRNFFSLNRWTLTFKSRCSMKTFHDLYFKGVKNDLQHYSQTNMNYQKNVSVKIYHNNSKYPLANILNDLNRNFQHFTNKVLMSCL